MKLATTDHELHLRQPDFCTFRSIRALCVSWNIDASRPHDLVGTMDNLEFLKNALHSADSPDIISFGFQEMVSRLKLSDENVIDPLLRSRRLISKIRN